MHSLTNIQICRHSRVQPTELTLAVKPPPHPPPPLWGATQCCREALCG